MNFSRQWWRIVSCLALAVLAPAAGAAPGWFGYVGTRCEVSEGCTLPASVLQVDLDSGRQTAAWPVPRRAEGVAVTPDGSRVLVAGSEAQVLSVLDAASGQVLASFPLPFAPKALTLQAGGTQAWVGGPTGVALVSTANGAVLASVPLPAVPGVQRLSPDGRRLYVALYDARLAVVDTTTRTLLAVAPTAATAINGMALSPDGSRLWLTVGLYPYGAGVLVMDTADLSLRATIDTVETAWAAVLAGPSAWVLTNGHLLQYDATTLAPLASIELQDQAYDLLLRPDGRLLVNAAGALLVVDPATRQVTARIGVQVPFEAFAVSPDGRRVLGSATPDALSQVDPVARTVRATLPTGWQPTGVALSVDGTRGAAGSLQSRGLTLFGPAGPVFVGAAALPSPSSSAVLSPDGRRAYAATLGSSYGDGALVVVDTDSSAVLATVPLPGVATAKSAAVAVVITPDGRKVYVSVALIPFEQSPPLPGYLLVYDTVRGRTARVLGSAGGDGLALSPDGGRLYAVSGGRIVVLATDRDRVVQKIRLSGVGAMAVSPDGQRLWAARPTDRQIVVLDTASGRTVGTLAVANGSNALAFTPDGLRVWATSPAPEVTVFDAATGTVVDTLPLAGTGSGIAFGP